MESLDAFANGSPATRLSHKDYNTLLEGPRPHGPLKRGIGHWGQRPSKASKIQYGLYQSITSAILSK